MRTFKNITLLQTAVAFGFLSALLIAIFSEESTIVLLGNALGTFAMGLTAIQIAITLKFGEIPNGPKKWGYRFILISLSVGCYASIEDIASKAIYVSSAWWPFVILGTSYGLYLLSKADKVSQRNIAKNFLKNE